MCLFVHDNGVLVGLGRDQIKNLDFYRVLGGSINFGETAENSVRREIREELKSEIANLRLLTVIENIFTWEGRRGHEIVFLYQGDFIDTNLYHQSIIHIQDGAYKFDAKWIPFTELLDGCIPLYPEHDYRKLLT